MKAFLLAAGLGTRLRPLTDHLPKCLVDIGGRPLLDIWLDALASAGVDEVLLNVHHLHHLVEEHVVARAGRAPFVRVVHEPVLLGSAGTLRANRDFVAGEQFFLAINADNLTTFDIGRLVQAHHSAPLLATLAVFHAPHPERCGIVTVRERPGGRLRGEARASGRETWRTRGSTRSTRGCSTSWRGMLPSTSVGTCCRRS